MIVKKVVPLALAIVVGLASSALAVEVWYDMEGDSGSVVTDKLIADGAQDGVLINNVVIQPIPSTTGNGDQNVAIGVIDPIPSPVNPPFSTIEVPDSTMLGAQYTLALWADCTTGDFTRMISSYGGKGGVGADRILVDFDTSGTAINGLRAIVNNVALTAPEFPAVIAEPGYHHYALTVDNGDLVVYVDGAPVITGNVGTGYSNAVNLRIGEDPHDLGGSANEQFAGNIDDFLAINQPLSAADIASLASGCPVCSVVAPGDEYAVYYDFEDGIAADKFTADGAQDAILHENVTISSDAALAQVGNGSASLGSAVAAFPLSEIDTGVSGTELGEEFTLSVRLNGHELGQTGGKLSRVFSNYAGSSSAAGRVILDIDQNETSNYGWGIRFLLPDGTAVLPTDIIPLNEDHTLTAVYDNGIASVYLDGDLVGSATGTGSLPHADVTIRVGEDVGGGLNEQFVGEMDDILILSRALSATQVRTLAVHGASAVIPEPHLLALFAGAVALLIARRRR